MDPRDIPYADGKTPDLHPVQIEIYRRMSMADKLRLASQLYWQARRMKKEWLRQRHPDWSEEQLDEEVRRIFLYATTP